MNIKEAGGEPADHNQSPGQGNGPDGNPGQGHGNGNGSGPGNGQAPWKLNVQGVVVESKSPTIIVEAALRLAGIDPTQGWIVVLKIRGEKRQVQLGDSIDLSLPGIERLRLTPKQINNGDGQAAPLRDFELLPKDKLFLDGCGYEWQTVNVGRRWLIISAYPLPAGYDRATCDLAIEIPGMYPAAELDMFYCNPPIRRADGVAIEKADVKQQIAGVTFQRWSRHRAPGIWSPRHDGVATHLGLVEESIAREVGA